MWPTIVTILALVLAVAAIYVGIKLIKGSWQIPPEKREKYAIGAIALALALGFVNTILAIKPKWLRIPSKSAPKPTN